MRVILLLILLNFSFSLSAQKSQKTYVQEVKYAYVKGDFDLAKTRLEKALGEYPTSSQLNALKSLIEDEGLVVKVPNPRPLPRPLPTPQPNPTPSPSPESPRPRPVNSDPDGDGFVGSKDKCPNEYGEVNGCPDSDGDKVPDYIDKCDDKPGPASNNGCPIPKLVTISVDLAMGSQNTFTWNSKVAEEGLKATLVFQTNSGAEFRKDVTGLSSFKFKSGDTRFDGVMTNVELIITTKDGVKITGITKIKTRTTC